MGFQILCLLLSVFVFPNCVLVILIFFLIILYMSLVLNKD